MKNFCNATLRLAGTLALQAALLCSAAHAQGNALAQQRETYSAETKKITAKCLALRQELDEKFTASVKAVEARYIAEANLDGVLAAREVLKAVEDPFADVTAPTQKNTDVLRRAVEQYNQQTRALDADETRQRDDLKTRYIASLERAKQKLTTEGKIDEALTFHNEIERLKKEMARAAPAAPAETKQPAPSKKSAPPKTENDDDEETTESETAGNILSEADIVDKIKSMAGTTITFTGRIKALEEDNAVKGSVIIVLEKGTKFRLAIPGDLELVKHGNGTTIRSLNRYGSYFMRLNLVASQSIQLARCKSSQILNALNAIDAFPARSTITVKADVIPQGVHHHAMPNTFVNTTLIETSAPVANWCYNLANNPLKPPPQPPRFLPER